MADHSKPTITSLYSNFVTEMDARYDDLAVGLDPAATTATNVPTNSIRWNSASNKWQKYNGTVWNDLSALYAINVSGSAGSLSTTSWRVVETSNELRFTDTAGNAKLTLNLTTGASLTSTGALGVPVGTTAERPTGSSGKIRFNSTVNKYEGHNGTTWSSIGGGATGGGSDDIFIENGQTVTTNYTISTGKNAMSAGPISINSGITVTIPSGSVWTVI